MVSHREDSFLHGNPLLAALGIQTKLAMDWITDLSHRLNKLAVYVDDAEMPSRNL